MKLKLIAMIAAAGLLSACTFSEGERAGTVSKFSRKGLICKTWEGELSMGGFRNKTTVKDGASSTDVVANIFEFSVIDPAVVEKVQDALLSGNRVSLVYDQKILEPWAFCDRDTQYVIVDVRVLQ